MAIAGTLEVQMFANLARIADDMQKAKRIVGDAVDSIKTLLGTIGVGLSAHYFKEMIDGAIESQDKLYELNIVTGASIDKLQQMRIVAKLAGTNFDGVGEAMVKLSRNMSGSGVETKVTTQALEFLNIKSKDTAGNFRDTADVMKEIAVKMNEYSDGAGKTAIVQDLLGKGAAVLLPYMKELGEATDRNTQVTEATVKQAHEYVLAQREMAAATSATWMAIANFLLPGLTELLKTFNALKAAGGWKAIFFGIDEFVGQADPIHVMQEKLDALMKTRAEFERMGAIKRLFSADDIAIVNTQISMLTSKLEVARKILAEKARALPALTDPSVDSAKPSLNYNRGDNGALAAAELKLYQGAMQRLELEINNLNGKSTEQNMRYEILHGSLQKLTAAHGAEVIALAKKLDAQKNEIAARDYLTKSYAEYGARLDATTNAVNDYAAANRTANMEQQLQIDLIGKTSYEQAKLNGLHQIELDFRAKAAAVPEGEAQADALVNMATEAEKTKSAFVDLYDTAYKKARDWTIGAKSAFDDYIDHATNAAEQTRALLSNAFKNAEDALVDFVTTGKFDFKKFADSIIADLARIQIKKGLAAVAGSMEQSGGFMQALGQITGFGNPSTAQGLSGPVTPLDFKPRAAGGPVSGGRNYLVGEKGPELFTPGSSGMITPNHALGATNTNINITYNPTGAGGAVDAQSMAATLIPIIKGVVRGEITTQLRPGGALA